VKQQIWTKGGCTDSTFHTVPVHPNPEAGFTFTEECLDQTTQFNDTSSVSTGSVSAWDWDFDDGNTSTNQSPTHTYASADTYDVQQIVTTGQGCTDTAVESVPVYPVPSADFSASVECQGDSTRFTDNSSISSGNISNWSWDFGDGNSSSLQNPAHLYDSSGTFNVTLVVTSDQGCQDSISKFVDVNSVPSADFSFTTTCDGEVTDFTDQSTIANGSITSWYWDFGDGDTSDIPNPNHTYDTVGSYQVTLIVNSAGGCGDTTVKTVPVHPNPRTNFTANTVCEGDSTQFNDLSSISSGNVVAWNWAFGDGNTDTVQHPTHQYSSSDTYDVNLSIVSDQGCTADTTISVVVHPSPRASYSVDNLCNTDTVFFYDESDLSPGSIVKWDWDLGNGDTDTVPNPYSTYDTAGSYPIELVVVSDQGCTDTLNSSLNKRPNPTADFTATDECLGDSTQFTNQSRSYSAVNWVFGDGNFSTENDPKHLYDSAGTYRVILRATTPLGCQDSTSKKVKVYELPAPRITPANDTIFAGESITLSADIGQQGATYQWSPGGSLDDAEVPKPEASPDQTTTYSVEVVDTNGCVGHDTTMLFVEEGFEVPNTFTPNGDGINDVWRIRGLRTFEEGLTIEIYNRWGDMVFETNDYQNDWGGTYQNKQLPAATYYYVIKFNGEDRDPMKGPVTIIR
jgi:gliding motility-associated-like protein